MKPTFNVKAIIAIAGMVLLGPVAAARADTLTPFTLDNVTFGDNGTGTASGTFVFDSTNNTLSSVNITTSAGTWQNGITLAEVSFGGESYNAGHITIGGSNFDFIFTNGGTTQLLLGVLNPPSLTSNNALLTAFPGNESFEGGVSSSNFAFQRHVSDGSLDPQVSATPLPASLPLFATGLGTLGLLGWRRKRKVAALAA